ncbi:hypothetical protein V5O48_018126 [Marasmius crinis-equi]|uniref:Transposase n=1 Tax=Marasmius crinis-equi TaxID=585013 RepID=A0ABR3EM95_9AGAR
MHLVFHNVLPTLDDLWTSDYKRVDTSNREFRLAPTVIEAVGSGCTEAGNTTPSAFGARVPNIATERHYFTAESWMLFSTMLGLALLHKWFKHQQYYNHFIKLVRLINKCLLLSIPRTIVNTEIRKGFAEWVLEYKRLYYQCRPEMLPVCTLPIHGLLHLADNIVRAGPVWCHWNFPTERFCGALVRASKSRKNPYASFAWRLLEIARLSQIKLLFNLRDHPNLSDSRDAANTGLALANYPHIHALKPHVTRTVDTIICKAIKNHLLRTYDLTDYQARVLIPQQLSQWSQIRFLEGGDTINCASLYRRSEQNQSREATFIKYTVEVNKNKRFRNLPVVMERCPAYSELLTVIELDLLKTSNAECFGGRQSDLLAVIRPAKLAQKNKLTTPYYYDGEFKPVEVINVDDISCLVARIPDRWPTSCLRWALYERPYVMGLEPEDEE